MKYINRFFWEDFTLKLLRNGVCLSLMRISVDNLISFALKCLVSYKGIIFQMAQGSKTGTSSIRA